MRCSNCWVALVFALAILPAVPGETAAVVVPTSAVQEDANSDSQPTSVLVTPDWLAKNIEQPNVVLLGLGQTQRQYSLAHIPGERFVDWRKDITDPKAPDRFNVPSADALQSLLRRLATRQAARSSS